MRWYSSIALLLLAVRPAIAAEPTAAQLREITDSLVPWVEEVATPFYVYHWAPRDEHEDLPRKNPSVDSPSSLGLLESAVDAYWRPQDGQVRAGLWTALDPTSSRNFGFDDWSLLRLEIPAGFHFLRTSDPLLADPFDGAAVEKLHARRALERARFARAMAAVGCPGGSETSVISSGDSVFMGPVGDAHCLEILHRVLGNELKVGAVFGIYPAATYVDCQHEMAGDFILTDTRGIGADRLRVFTAETREAPEERRFIQALFDIRDSDRSRFIDKNFSRLRRAFSVTSKGRRRAREEIASRLYVQSDNYPRLWNDLGAAPKDSVLRPWMKAHLMACDEHLRPHVPDAPPSGVGCASTEAAPGAGLKTGQAAELGKTVEAIDRRIR